ncbi:MAG: phosphotransferase [Candidatus Delongbacteria bacterium]|nr:phosphotransferase [Candidatus Delongbacteria bacterium]MBN2836393.1 phosphotransferase [Candidatus Delongbacteria bacterium]
MYEIKNMNIEDKSLIEMFTKIVNNVLLQYDLEIEEVLFHGFYTNTIFRINTKDGKSYALRVSYPGWRTELDLYSEAKWLSALANSTDIGAVIPIPSKSGEFSIKTTLDDVDTHVCLLMNWLDGDMLADNLTNDNIFKMGELFAKLHIFSENYRPEGLFTDRKMSNIFARGEKNILFEESSRKYFSDKNWMIFNEANNRISSVYETLYSLKDELMVINHDLHHENIIIDSDGKLRAFDFEDTVWGYPVQDIAMAMKDLMEEIKPELFPEFLKSFRKGYESLRKWPERFDSEMDIFMAGRVLWVTNWVGRFQTDRFERNIDWAAEKLGKFLETGKLRF